MSENSIYNNLSTFFQTVNQLINALERRYVNYPGSEHVSDLLHHIESLARYSDVLDLYQSFQSHFVFMTHAFRELTFYGIVKLSDYTKALEILRYQAIGVESIADLNKVTRRCIYQMLCQYQNELSGTLRMIINTMREDNEE